MKSLLDCIIYAHLLSKSFGVVIIVAIVLISQCELLIIEAIVGGYVSVVQSP